MALTPITIQRFVGLHLQANSFSQVPDGSMERADNLVVSNDGIVRKRRGYFNTFVSNTQTLSNMVALTEYMGSVICASNGSLLSRLVENPLNELGASWSSLFNSGIFFPHNSDNKPRFAQSNGNLYGTSTAGVRKLENLVLNNLLPSGIPQALDVTVSLSSNLGIMKPDSNMAYRVVFGRKDANLNKVTGAPSELGTVSNGFVNSAASYTFASTSVTFTSIAHGFSNGDTVVISDATDANVNGTWVVSSATANTFVVVVLTAPTIAGTAKLGKFRTPTVSFSLPSAFTSAHFYQLYRTTQTAGLAVSAPDDGQLINEANLSAGQISAGIVTFVDDIEELFKGAALYTNPNQSGIQASNYEPPLCKDLALFKNCMFYANTETKHELTFTLVSTQVADLVAGDIVTIGGAVYEATLSAPNASPAIPNTSVSWNFGGVNAGNRSYFQLTNSSSTSVAVPISLTARSLCRAINARPSGTLNAYYTSGASDIPGNIRLNRKVFGSSFTALTANNTVGDAFSPNLFNTGLGRSSSNSVLPNSVSFSKPYEPEAVPLPYQLIIGAKSSAILRIIPLRDSLMVLKQDSLWRISGESPSTFTVTLIDNTISCVAGDSAVNLANQVFFLSSQGVVAATETSASVLSRPIEAVIAPILGSPVISAQTNACGYESERLYILSTIQPGSTTADVVYCYNTVTESWTNWDRTFVDQFVFTGNNTLYSIDTFNRLLKERKSQTNLDYCDFGSYVTCTSFNNTLKTAQFSGDDIFVGDVIVRNGVSSNVLNKVKSVDLTTTPPTIEFFNPIAFQINDICYLYKPIISVLKTTPLTLGDSTVWKMYTDMRLAFRNKLCSRLSILFDNDSRSSSLTNWANLSDGYGWGFNWGTEWGGDSINSVLNTQASQMARVLIPLETSRGTYIQTQITHNQAAESFELQALSITSRPFGHRVTK